jgi:hypothetical protein
VLLQAASAFLVLLSAGGEAMAVRPPKTVGPWTRPDAPQVIDAATIFGYMDGAGELYLAYRFRQLDAYQYEAPDRDPILVELYLMESSDDAYGLLSTDWSGEALGIDPAAPSDPPRALYGAGLLRLWSDDLYVRVLAERETSESRTAVLDLATAIAASRRRPPPPALAASLPRRIAGGGELRRDRLVFLRSHLVLNSVYFLSTQDVLGLDRSVEAAIAPYGLSVAGAEPPRLLLVRYSTEVAARSALSRFRNAYLPEASASGRETAGTQRVEHGVVGYRISGNALAVVFDGPDEASVRDLLTEAVQSLAGAGGQDE